MSNYGWVITKIYDPDCQDEVGVMGPNDIPAEIGVNLQDYQENGLSGNSTGDSVLQRIVRFRCFTDDRNDTDWELDGPPGLIYEGLLWLKDGVSGDDGMGLLGPLDDFCMPNYGCAMIEHYVDNEWQMLVA